MIIVSILFGLGRTVGCFSSNKENMINENNAAVTERGAITRNDSTLSMFSKERTTVKKNELVRPSMIEEYRQKQKQIFASRVCMFCICNICNLGLLQTKFYCISFNI